MDEKEPKPAFRDAHKKGIYPETHPEESARLHDFAERIGIRRGERGDASEDPEKSLTPGERRFIVDFFTQPELNYSGYYARDHKSWNSKDREDEYRVVPLIMPWSASFDTNSRWVFDEVHHVHMEGAFAYALRYAGKAKISAGEVAGVEAQIGIIGFDVDMKERIIYVQQVQGGSTHSGSIKNEWQRDAMNRIDYRQLLYDMVFELAIRNGFKQIAVRRAGSITWFKVRENRDLAKRNYDTFAGKNKHVPLPPLERIKDAFKRGFFPMARKKSDYLYRNVPQLDVFKPTE